MTTINSFKTMVYISEDFNSYGHKQVKFNFKKGQKIMSDGKFIICCVVGDLSRDAHLLVKNEFAELKNSRMSIREKANRLSLFVESFSGDEGADKARVLLNGYRSRLSECLDKVCDKVL